MSKPTFLKTVKILEDEEKISIIGKGTLGTSISTDLNLKDYANKGPEYFAELFDIFERKLENHLNKWADLSNEQRADSCFLLIKAISLAEIKFNVYHTKIDNPETRKLKEKLTELKEWVIQNSFMDPMDEGNFEHMDIINSKIDYEMNELSDDFDKTLNK